jgi:hypothetical protein
MRKSNIIRYYTEQEENLIKSYIKNGKTAKENVKVLAKKMKRTEIALAVKYSSLRKKMGLSSWTKDGSLNKNKFADIPKGMTMEFPAARVVLKENSVTFYFE